MRNFSLTILCLISFGCDESVTPAQPQQPAPTPELALVPGPAAPSRQERNRALFNKLKSALARTAAGDPTAEKIAAAFAEQAAPAQLFANGQVSVDLSDHDPALAMAPVVLLDRSEIGYLGAPAPSAFFYNPAVGAFALIDSGEVSDWFMGVIMLHEASHWYDMTIDHIDDPTALAGSDTANRGEVRAHLRESAALDRLTQGGYTEAVKRALTNPLNVTDVTGASYKTLNRRGLEEVTASLPVSAKSPSEEGAREGDAYVYSVLLQLDTETDRAAAYGQLTRQLR